MAEYGRGIGEVAGRSGGGGQAPGQTTDLGATFMDFVTNSVDRVAALEPGALITLAVIVLLGLVVLKRAF